MDENIKNDDNLNDTQVLDETEYETGIKPEDRAEYYKKEVISWIKTLAVSFFTVYVINALFIQIVFVNGTSMLPTLNGGDKLVANKLISNFERGDIVVIENEYPDNLIKRVIATEGETIKIDFETGDVYINGQMLYEPYINSKTYSSYGFSGEVTVPAGHVFVMGDNRNASNDSRNAEIGFIDVNNIFGVTNLRIYPFDAFGLVE